MKILMTTDTVGGVWTYTLELARALERHGVEIVLASMGPLPTSDQLDELRTIANVRLRTSEYKLEWMDEPWDDVERAGQWLMRLQKQVRPDLVHLNGYAHGALEWHSPHLVVGHSCVMSWWEAVKGEPAPNSWDRYRSEVTRGLHAAQLVLAPTQAMLGALERYYGALAATGVVFNGRDRGLFAPGRKEAFVFTAGRTWDEAKNIAVLEKIASRLAWPVYVAGEAQHPAGGVSQTQNVRRLGRLAPQVLPQWYARASIYALPARYEPFGLSALEAALAGCALVLGDIGSLREVWGDAALFVPPDDEDALEESIGRLISDRGLLAEMADRARTRALCYTPERMAEKYLEAVSATLPEVAVLARSLRR